MVRSPKIFGSPFLLEECFVLQSRRSDALKVVEVVFRPVLSWFLRSVLVTTAGGFLVLSHVERTGTFSAWNVRGIAQDGDGEMCGSRALVRIHETPPSRLAHHLESSPREFVPLGDSMLNA